MPKRKSGEYSTPLPALPKRERQPEIRNIVPSGENVDTPTERSNKPKQKPISDVTTPNSANPKNKKEIPSFYLDDQETNNYSEADCEDSTYCDAAETNEEESDEENPVEDEDDTTKPEEEEPPIDALKILSVTEKWLIPYTQLKIEKELGSGAFGAVYHGKYRHTTVAIKVTRSVAQRQLTAFVDEVKVMVNIPPHANVVQIYGVCIHKSKPHMVLEYMNGGSLEFLLRQRSLLTDELYDIVWGVALGMEHLHAHNVIHRDLAARNILLTETNKPKIGDFGMSRLVNTEEDEGKTQTAFGPIAWMAPETLKTKSYSAKSDAWSYGILIWECIERQNPSEQMDLMDLAISIRDKGHTPTKPKCDQKLLKLMDMCWKQAPSDRPSFTDICEYLEEIR